MTKGFHRGASLVGVVVALFLAGALAASAWAAPPPPPGPLGPTLDLHAGWNMISSPINAVPLSVIQGTCLISNGPWWWTGTHYQQSATIEPAKGYWVLVGDACTMVAYGSSFPQTLHLAPGWNMISSSGSWNQMNTGGCSLLSGPFWYDGTKYQQVPPEAPLDGFKGYWVKVDGNCIVDSQRLHPSSSNDSLPPAPPAVSAGFFVGLLTLIGLPQTTAAPQRTHLPPTLQDIGLTPLSAGLAELHLRGTGIISSELRLFNLGGDLVADRQGTGDTLRVWWLGANGRPLANGVYLYLVIVRGADGQMASSEVRKVLLRR